MILTNCVLDIIVHVLEEDVFVLCPTLVMVCGSAVLTAIGCVFGPIGKCLKLFFG